MRTYKSKEQIKKDMLKKIEGCQRTIKELQYVVDMVDNGEDKKVIELIIDNDDLGSYIIINGE